MSNRLTPNPAPRAPLSSWRRKVSRRFQPTPSYRIFLDLLVRERQSRNVTQYELASRLSLSPAQVETLARSSS